MVNGKLHLRQLKTPLNPRMVPVTSLRHYNWQTSHCRSSCGFQCFHSVLLSLRRKQCCSVNSMEAMSWTRLPSHQLQFHDPTQCHRSFPRSRYLKNCEKVLSCSRASCSTLTHTGQLSRSYSRTSTNCNSTSTCWEVSYIPSGANTQFNIFH